MSPIMLTMPSICSASSTSSGRWSLISANVRKPRSLPSTISVFRRRLRASTSAGVSTRGAISACRPLRPFLLAASAARLPAILAAISPAVGLCAGAAAALPPALTGALDRRYAAPLPCRRGSWRACRPLGDLGMALARAWPCLVFGATLPGRLSRPSWRRISAPARTCAEAQRSTCGRRPFSWPPASRPSRPFSWRACAAISWPDRAFLAAERRAEPLRDAGRAFAPGRFFAAVFRDLGLAGDLRAGFAGFLAMVILTSRVRTTPERGGRATRWGRWGKPQIISSGYRSREVFANGDGRVRRTISSWRRRSASSADGAAPDSGAPGCPARCACCQ